MSNPIAVGSGFSGDLDLSTLQPTFPDPLYKAIFAVEYYPTALIFSTEWSSFLKSDLFQGCFPTAPFFWGIEILNLLLILWGLSFLGYFLDVRQGRIADGGRGYLIYRIILYLLILAFGVWFYVVPFWLGSAVSFCPPFV